MEIDETDQSGDVTENPPQPEEIESGAGGENAPDVTKTDSEPANAQPAAKTGDFSSFFSKARQSAQAAQAQGTEADDSSKTDDATAQTVEESTDSDDTNPDEDDTETGNDAADKPNETDKTDDPEKAKETEEAKEQEEGKKPSRVEKYQRVISERDTLKTENETFKTRLESLDAQLEKHGGVEAVEPALEFFELAADAAKAGDFVEKIKTLPHSAQIQRKVFDDVLALPANRTYGVNRVLQEDFGLAKALPQTTLEKAFEFISSRVNTDAEGFELFLERELELLGTDESSEIEKLRAEVQSLKNPPKETDAQKDNAPVQETEADFANRIQKTYNDFEDSSFTKVSLPEMEKYGFAPTSNDAAPVKQAKEFVASAVKLAVAAEMRQANAHDSLLGFWVENLPTDSPFYKQAEKNYQRAMTVKVQNALKLIAPLLGAKSSAPPKEAKGSPNPDPAMPKIANAQNNQTQRSAQNNPRTHEKPKGFASAFSEARKQTGSK